MEWVGGDRRLDAAIVGVLEMMNLPYTGSGPDGMQLARDKALGQVIVAVGIPCRNMDSERRGPEGDLPLPAIVKPQFGDGSDGIARSALVRIAASSRGGWRPSGATATSRSCASSSSKDAISSWRCSGTSRR